MPEIARLNGLSAAIELDFVERVATFRNVMKLAMELYLSGLSPSITVSILEILSISWARSTVHNWVQKADLEPEAGRNPDKIALDETVVKVEGERFWVYSAVDAETKELFI